jgi:hypothetical protein
VAIAELFRWICPSWLTAFSRICQFLMCAHTDPGPRAQMKSLLRTIAEVYNPDVVHEAQICAFLSTLRFMLKC